MDTDFHLKRQVESELAWDPEIGHSTMAVAVSDGTVMLSGFVATYAQKLAAERAVKRVAGVRAVANELVVQLGTGERPDPEIAADAVTALRLQLPTAATELRTVVDHGHLKLEGCVQWHYQRERAEQAVRHLAGVKSVLNQIRVVPPAQPGQVQHQILAAFHRDATLDAKRVHVEANGHEVVLSGAVRSWSERQSAERAAWQAPGVSSVDNRIAVL